MSHPLVSIIIPVYNVEAYIAECIQSVMNQTTTEKIECLVVDDCGTDNSIKIAKELIDVYSGPINFRITSHRHNRGVAAARNTGIRETTGKYIFYLDSDDYITPDAIQSLLDVARRWPDAQIVSGKFEKIPSSESLGYYDFKKIKEDINLTDKRAIRRRYLFTFPIMAWNKLILRSFILNNNLFYREGIVHEDDNWQARSYHIVSNIAICNKVTYHYRIHSSSIMANRLSLRNFDSLIVTAKEMFVTTDKWDRPWIDWVISSVDRLSENFGTGADKEYIAKQYREVLDILYSNHAIPRLVKLAMLYYKCPLNHPKWMHRYLQGLYMLGFYR